MYRDDVPAYWQDQLLEWGPRLLFALLILIATHFIAKAVEWAIAKAVKKVPALQKDPDLDGTSIGQELGRLGYWLVWLVGLVAALQPLGLNEVLEPVTRLTTEVFEFLPRLIGAAVIFIVGLIVARVVKHLVEAALRALNVEGWAQKAGFHSGADTVAVDSDGDPVEGAPTPARHGIARAIGLIVFALIIIPVSIAAIDTLGIAALSGPLTSMLELMLDAIPRILQAVFWLAIFFVAARAAKMFIESVLPALGVDNYIRSLGVMESGAQPSRIAGAIVFIAILLIGAIEAMRAVGGDQIAALLFQITELGGKVIFGTVIITVGLFLSRLLARLVGSSAGEGSWAQTIVRYAVIALFTAIGLTFMGLANEIVILAFGLILGSAAVAAALAFGLGGRDAAARQLERWQAEQNAAPRSPAPKRIKKATPPDGDDGQAPLV